MPIPTTSRLGYGLMNFTWKPTHPSDEQAFEAIRTAVDGGSTMLNSGDFYGHPEPTLNLQLLARFYDKYPEYVEKTYVAVKTGYTNDYDSTEETLRKSAERVNELLGGKKKMDLFQVARVTKKQPIEETIKNMAKLRDQGLFKDIGISECSADSVRRAASVTQIAAVEVEYSPWSLDIEHNGVLAAAKELGIPIVAYSPLGRGMMAGTIRKPEDIPEGDMRRHLDRFKPGNFQKNIKLVEKLEAVAKRKEITPTQLTLAWLISKHSNIYPIPGSTRVEGVRESLKALEVKLSEEEQREIQEIVASADVVGGRYFKAAEGHLEG